MTPETIARGLSPAQRRLMRPLYAIKVTWDRVPSETLWIFHRWAWMARFNCWRINKFTKGNAVYLGEIL